LSLSKSEAFRLEKYLAGRFDAEKNAMIFSKEFLRRQKQNVAISQINT